MPVEAVLEHTKVERQELAEPVAEVMRVLPEEIMPDYQEQITPAVVAEELVFKVDLWPEAQAVLVSSFSNIQAPKQ
jgi:hypothetical protein